MSFPVESTVFAILSFEGPDVYSQAGGLGVRVKELARALADTGYETHVFFVGDPDRPAVESDRGVTLHRWAQWLSKSHPGGVYDGEEPKIADWNRSLPGHLADYLIAPAHEAGKRVVVLGEEWHTAASMVILDDVLYYRGVRAAAVMLWNANNTFGFDRIDFLTLGRAATITTVSRYMKHQMWQWHVNPIVIPNGIPAAAITDPDPNAVAAIREAAAADLLTFKIGRFDPGKRWLMAITALGVLKRQGLRVRLMMRGGSEPHGADVLSHAATHGLRVEDVRSPRDAAGIAKLWRAHPEADVLNLVSFLPESILGTLYAASNAVLANSGHEPFGLVGLEVMGAGGLAVTGSTGEDYAEPFRNAIVLETDDPLELATALSEIRRRPDWAIELRARGRETALSYTWDHVIEQLLSRLELAAARQSAPR